MATVKRFEDLACWKKARELENYVYGLTQKGTFKIDFELRGQIHKSTGSAMDNISEGFGRGSNREFVNFLIIANGSATEAKSQIYRALDRRHIRQLSN
jgi:four helix bundle protein